MQNRSLSTAWGTPCDHHVISKFPGISTDQQASAEKNGKSHRLGLRTFPRGSGTILQSPFTPSRGRPFPGDKRGAAEFYKQICPGVGPRQTHLRRSGLEAHPALIETQTRPESVPQAINGQRTDQFIVYHRRGGRQQSLKLLKTLLFRAIAV